MSPRRRESVLPDRPELNMTPMIDVVFQLLAFFLLTLTFSKVEGDFQIKMPLVAREGRAPEPLPTLQVRLVSGERGELAGIFVNGRPLERTADLRAEAIRYSSDANGPGRIEEAEVVIDADERLRYEHVIEAITQVSGVRQKDGSIVKLIERIKFGRGAGFDVPRAR